MADMLEAARRYVAAGFSVIPLHPEDRTPALEHWNPYRQRFPTDIELVDWFYGNNPYGIGIVLGGISSNASAVDLDHPPFRAWLEARFPMVFKTWCVDTSNKSLHIFFRSLAPQATYARSHNGDRLFDYKGEGGYVCADPSRHPISGGYYHTVGRDPEHVIVLPDAWSLVQRIYAQYVGEDEGYDPNIPTTPRAPLEGTERDELEARIQNDPMLIAKFKKTILLPGQGAGSTYWLHKPSDSEVQMSVLNELVERGYDEEDCHNMLATFPVGALCYRDRTRSNHGPRLFANDWQKAVLWYEKKKAAIRDVHGENFLIPDVLYLRGDDPRWEMRVARRDDGFQRTVTLGKKQLWGQDTMLMEVSAVLNIVADLPKAMKDTKEGHFYRSVFVAGIMAKSREEDVPLSGRNSGYLTAALLTYLRKDGTIMPRAPETPAEFQVGFIDGDEVWVRAIRIIGHLQQNLRPSPEPGRVWDSARTLGALERPWHYPDGTTDKTGAMWLLPRSVLGGA